MSIYQCDKGEFLTVWESPELAEVVKDIDTNEIVDNAVQRFLRRIDDRGDLETE